MESQTLTKMVIGLTMSLTLLVAVILFADMQTEKESMNCISSYETLQLDRNHLASYKNTTCDTTQTYIIQEIRIHDRSGKLIAESFTDSNGKTIDVLH